MLISLSKLIRIIAAKSSLISIFATNISKTMCPKCGHGFDYGSISEAGMGYVKCPKCGKAVHQGNIIESTKASDLKGFVIDIEKATVGNDNFRKVLYTGKNSQLVLMSLKPGEDIGEEIHKDTDQFFRIDSGKGKVVINGKETEIKDGFAIVVPQGAKHNVVNTGDKPLKLYTIYSPPHHLDGVVHKSKEEAEADKEDHYDGKTTE